MDNALLTLIFPMAGSGIRFGGRFKPFLEIDGRKFIEAALEPFLKWKHRLGKIVFVYLREQDEAYDVSAWLTAKFSHFPIELVVLEKATPGPAITVFEAIRQAAIEGPIICCDCDHSVNVDPIFTAIDGVGAEAIIPAWPLAHENIAAWSIVAATPEGVALDIAEKRMPETAGPSYGAIGCTFFQSAQFLLKLIETMEPVNLSEVLQALIKGGRPVRIALIKEAEFFGDPTRLRVLLERRGQDIG